MHLPLLLRASYLLLDNTHNPGVITAAAAFAVNLGVENISGFKFWATLTLLERGQPVASFLVYALVNCVLIGVSVYVTVNYAPAAAGSGIAEVKVSRGQPGCTLALSGLLSQGMLHLHPAGGSAVVPSSHEPGNAGASCWHATKV